jgi:hypothetical protein
MYISNVEVLMKSLKFLFEYLISMELSKKEKEDADLLTKTFLKAKDYETNESVITYSEIMDDKQRPIAYIRHETRRKIVTVLQKEREEAKLKKKKSK